MVRDDSNRWTEELETEGMEGNLLVQDNDSRVDQQHIDEDEAQPCEDHAGEDETINNIEDPLSRNDDLYEHGDLEEGDVNERLSGTNPCSGVDNPTSGVEVDRDGVVLDVQETMVNFFQLAYLVQPASLRQLCMMAGSGSGMDAVLVVVAGRA